MSMCLRGRRPREGVSPKTSLQLLFSFLYVLIVRVSSSSGPETIESTGANFEGVNCPALGRTGTRPAGHDDRGRRGYHPSSLCKRNAVADARNAAYLGRRKCRPRGKPQGSAMPVRRFIEGVRGGAAGRPDPYKARMQVMITRNMRKALVEELGYLSDEVDDMDPQIAAVVIEKSLPRPRAGMPIVWRRTIRRHGNVSTNPLASIARAVRKAVGVTLQGVAAVAAFPFRVFGAGVEKRRAAAVAVLLMVAAVPVIIVMASSQNTHPEGRFSGSSAVGGLATKLGSSFGALWPIGGGGVERVRSTGTPVVPTNPRKNLWVERRTSKADATTKNASTGKRRVKASGNPLETSSFGRRRGLGKTGDVITKAKPDGVEWVESNPRKGAGTRWDLDGVGDEEGEEAVRSGESVGSFAEEAVLFEDLSPAPPAPGTIGVPEENREGEINGEKGTRWGGRPLSEHIPSEEELEAWESRAGPSESWLDRGINKIVECLFGEGKDGRD